MFFVPTFLILGGLKSYLEDEFSIRSLPMMEILYLSVHRAISSIGCHYLGPNQTFFYYRLRVFCALPVISCHLRSTGLVVVLIYQFASTNFHDGAAAIQSVFNGNLDWMFADPDPTPMNDFPELVKFMEIKGTLSFAFTALGFLV